MATQVTYETWYGGEELPALRFAAAVRAAAEAPETRTLCEVGAGANPILSLEFARQAGISDYVITDISDEELAKAPQGYRKVVADVTQPGGAELGPFDLVVTQTVAEHVRDPAGFHRNVFGMLAPGGLALHFFPTLYEPAFVLNLLLPEAAADWILQRVQSNRARGGKHEKFPAHYRWCRGPTGRQLDRLAGVGFVVERYVGVFGQGYYHPVPPVDRLGARVAELLARHPVPALTAYAWVALRRPPPSPR
jgi:2-polyprenyl-3-methyl-5-hydroxy-6-metoxy-1,4-benzoquinol methylase